MSRFQRLFRKNYSCSERSQKTTGRCFFRPNLIIFIFVFLFIITYLFQVTSISHLGYEVRELEDRASELQSVNTKLELKAARLQSITRVEERARKLGFVEVDNIEYLDNNNQNNEIIVAAVK